MIVLSSTLLFALVACASSISDKNNSTKVLDVQISGQVSHGKVLSCPRRFFRYKNVCLQASDIRASWAEAQIYCRSIHKRADLASLVSAEEAVAIRRHIETDPNLRIRSFWIGASRMRDQRHWEWLSLRRRISWPGDWRLHQPDNSGGAEFCVLMDWRFEHQWNDMPCHVPHHFLCEIRDTQQRRRRRLRKFLY